MPPGRSCDWRALRFACTQIEPGEGVGVGVPDGLGLGVGVPDGLGDSGGLEEAEGLPLGDGPGLSGAVWVWPGGPPADARPVDPDNDQVRPVVRMFTVEAIRCPVHFAWCPACGTGQAKAGSKTMLHARKNPAPSAEIIMPRRGSAVGTASSVGFSGPRRTGRFGPFHLTRSPWRFPSLAGCRGRQAARRGIGGIPIMESRSPPRRLLGPWPCTDRGYVHIAWRGHE